MKITTIEVQAGRTLSPRKFYYQNLKPQITLTAVIEKGEDAIEKTKELHRLAENLLEDQCDDLIAFVSARMQARERRLEQAEKAAAKASDQ